MCADINYIHIKQNMCLLMRSLCVDTILGEQTSTTNSNERLWLEFLFSALLIPFTDMDPVAIAMLADSKRISK